MLNTKHADRHRLPSRFEDLVRLMPPRAILDEAAYANTVEMVDALMAAGKLTRGQELYLETLVQLVQTYEARHHAIETAGLSGLEVLKHLLAENDLNASDLARLLGVHASMGSKILKGERSLTVEHIRKLAERFKVEAQILLR